MARSHAGLVVEAEPAALAFALESALTPPSPATRQAARQLAASAYSWPAIAEALQTHYQQILARR